MKIGIPKAFLYYRYHTLWKTFFEELGHEVVLSPDTNKKIVKKGNTYAIDEACFSSKIYLGHVEWLIDKCDYILVPRVSGYGDIGTVCTKFNAIYDVVKNTFRDRDIDFLNYNIDFKNSFSEMKVFLKMRKKLKSSILQTAHAYLIAKQAQKTVGILERNKQEEFLNKEGIKILLIGRRYNIEDNYIGKPITNYLKKMNTIYISGNIADKNTAIKKSEEISETLPWRFNKELLGAILLYKEKIDGIIIMSSFPCGPDSLVNEIINRRIKDKPILNLTLDDQEGSAGVETRIESFIDIIKFKKGDYSGRI